MLEQMSVTAMIAVFILKFLICKGFTNIFKQRMTIYDIVAYKLIYKEI